MIPQSSTNLRSRVNKLNLPTRKALYPLFEVVSNSIHAIDEVETKVEGEIIIKTIRNGSVDALLRWPNIEQYPINTFIIKDNGVGLNNDNILSFAEFDSEKKITIGGKGVGRLICLKAYSKLIVESNYLTSTGIKLRRFEYGRTKKGFDKYEEDIISNSPSTGSSVTLSRVEEKYQNHIPKEIIEIGRQIISHFQLYYIQDLQPKIIIRNQNGIEVNLTNLYHREFEKEILKDNFDIGGKNFNVYISKSYRALSHKIHYCAHQRIVRSEGIIKYINDFNKKVIDEKAPEPFYFQVFVVSDYLDANVNESRTSFNFTIDDSEEEEEQYFDLSLSKIRKHVVLSIEKILSEFLQEIRKEKMDIYKPIIEEEYPNYVAILNHNREIIEKLPSGLSKQELDLKLYEIESNWRVEIKTKGLDLIDPEKDITNLEDYKDLYEDFLSQFNEIGQADLARYVVHRRAVIDLLDKLIELNEDDKFENEDIVHSLFFPIRERGKSVAHDKQNLWLLDERLTYNSLLASDKLFTQVEELGSTSTKRIDLVVKKEELYENATLYSEDKHPFESFTIVEFKKPERDDYSHGNYKKDPVKQVRTYIEEIIKGKIKLKGKRIEADIRTPFYCYIVADITPTLKYILDYESFDPTPDGLGFFRFYETKTSRAYIEVVPFKKVVKDAKQRNKILFDKLKLS